MILDSDVLPVRVADFAAGPVPSDREIAEAAREQALYAGRTDSAWNALVKAYADRIRAVREATGVTLENPMAKSSGTAIAVGTLARLPTGATPAMFVAEQMFDVLDQEERQNRFAERLVELATQFPEQAMAIRADLDPRDEAKLIQQRAEAALAEAFALKGTLRALPAALAGGLVGGFTDPLALATAALGPASAAGRTGLTALVRAGLGSAAAAGAATAVAEPFIQAQRAEAGLPAGLSEAAVDVAWASAFGGALGLGLEGGAQAIRALRGAAREAAPPQTRRPVARPAPEAPPAAAREEPQATAQTAFDDAAVDRTLAEAEARAPEAPPETRAAVTALRSEREAEAATPPNVAPEDHLEALTAAERFLDDPETAPPPKDVMVPDKADGPAIADDNGGSFDARVTIGGKPAFRTLVKAADLQFDAQTFQYKGGGDAHGVTEKLRGVTVWDQSSAGWVYVYEATDGTRFVADGHQRTGLAKRLMAEGIERDIELPAFVFREADGWTPSEVRARAAQKNIREGTGDVIDTATVLREFPALLDRSVPLGTAHMRQARALAALSPEAFGMVRVGVLAPHIAQAIGEQAADAPHLHAGLAEALVRQEVATAEQARLVVAAALRLGAKQAEEKAQFSLFGEDFFAETHIMEQAKVLSAALKKLGQDARLFAMLRDKGERIEAKGNVLVADVNARTAELAKAAAEIVEKLARTDGPVADIVDAAARAVAAKELTVPQAAEKVAADVIALFEREGLQGVLQRGSAAPAPEPRPAEPATAEALEKAERRRQATEPPAPRRTAGADEPVERIDAGEGVEIAIHRSKDGPQWNVVMRDREADETVAVSIAPSLDQAREIARKWQNEAAARTAAASERTAAGEQMLIPGVAPVSERERLEAAAAEPLRGGDAPPPAGGLFDDAARAQRDLMDLLPADGERETLVTPDRLDAQAKREGEVADMIDLCTVGRAGRANAQ